MSKYTVSDLADMVGVPRTTINDWLNRYAQYIDFRMQGKRKVYSDTTVAVLKEIGDLRNQGLSSFDIEEELVKRHPVHGEVATPPANAAEGHSEGAVAPPSVPVAIPSTEEFALISKQQNEELATMVGEYLQNLNTRINDLEEHNRAIAEKSKRWYGVAAMLTVALVVVAIAFGLNMMDQRHIGKLEKDYQALSGNYEAATKNLRMTTAEANVTNKKLQETEKKVVNLSDKNKDLAKDLDGLQKDLVKQEEAFKKMQERATESADEAKAREAQILKLRDEFAAERLKLLKSLEDAGKQNKEKDSIVKKLQEQSLEQSKVIKSLTIGHGDTTSTESARGEKPVID